jgi:V8-like Glu-specific endopeptidase
MPVVRSIAALTACTLCINGHAQLRPQGDNGINAFISKASVLVATPGSNGSATIVGSIRGKLLLLTAKHVVDGTAPSESIDIYNSDGDRIARATGSQIKKSASYDIAFIVAERLGNACIVPATFGDSSLKALSKLEQGDQVGVAGFASTDDALTRKPVLRISGGAITSILSEQEAINGYQFSYNAATARGMSGGGVFVWRNGLVLIGTHGSGEKDAQRDFAKTGFNYAVPADKAYSSLRSSLGSALAEAQLGNITISRGKISETLSAICTEPFGEWYCSTAANDATGANDQVCYVGNGDSRARRRIVVSKGRCGYGSHPLCGYVPGYE